MKTVKLSAENVRRLYEGYKVVTGKYTYWSYVDAVTGAIRFYRQNTHLHMAGLNDEIEGVKLA